MVRSSKILLTSMAIVACDGPASQLPIIEDATIAGGDITRVCPGAGWIAGNVTGDLEGIRVAFGVPVLHPGDTEHYDYEVVDTILPDADGWYAYNGSAGSMFAVSRVATPIAGPSPNRRPCRA